MSIMLPLDEMTVAEKLQLMEAIWDDLTRHDEAVESPEWHRDVLAERERRIESGEARFILWEEAKADIRNLATEGLR